MNPVQLSTSGISFWQENKFFQIDKPDNREAYTIVIPPPNVTGVLHMGHMLNNTLQDVLIRRARMLGEKMHAGFREPTMPLLPQRRK